MSTLAMILLDCRRAVECLDAGRADAHLARALLAVQMRQAAARLIGLGA